MRWGPGPVFFYECLANSRRWQTYAIRAVGVAVILAAIATIALPSISSARVQDWRAYAELGESYFYAIIGVELALVMLAAPAATAGAICVDRARGTLTHMLATDLSDLEIVLGKLAARLLPVLGLVACSWPVLAVTSLLGGIDPIAVNLAFAIILAIALLGCAMALALSVWARKPHEVVLVVYTFWMLVLLFWPIWYGLAHVGVAGRPDDWALVANPYYLAYAPYSVPGKLGLWDYVGFFAAALGMSAVLAGLAVWRMRPVARRGAGEDRARSPGLGLVGRVVRRLPGPSLDGNPVLWREWHRSRPSRWMIALAVLVGGSSGIVCLVVAGMVWRFGVRPGPPSPWLLAGMSGLIIHLIFGMLMLSASAPTSMAEERQRGSLDLLAATSLSTPTIVLGKWLGVLRPVALLTIGPGILALALATHDRQDWPATALIEDLPLGDRLFVAGLLVATILVHGALIASVGVAVATWIARQSRAIAVSVGLAVMVGAGWPILVGVTHMGGPGGASLMGLSPIVAAWGLTLKLAVVFYQSGTFEGWVAFWDVECLTLALGLLWLTARTFDGCFGRIPERPRRATVLSDVVVVLAGMVGVAALFGAVGVWSQGAWNFMAEGDSGVIMGILLVAVGFVLVSALSASLMSHGTASPARPPSPVVGRRLFARRWWEAYRLVLLLAIGPALMAIATAMARLPVRTGTWVRTFPGGTVVQSETDPTGITYTRTTIEGRQRIREATEADLAAAGLETPSQVRARLLRLAGSAVFMVLAYGAAFVSVGAMLGLAIRRRGAAILASAGLAVFVTMAWPLCFLVFLGHPDYDWGLTLSSVIPAYCVLVLRMYRPEVVPDMAEWIGCWDIIMILTAVIATGLALVIIDRRSRGTPAAGEVSLHPAVGESGSTSIWERVTSK